MNWKEYFDSLPEVVRQSYDGNCNCVFCQQIRDDYYKQLEVKENKDE